MEIKKFNCKFEYKMEKKGTIKNPLTTIVIPVYNSKNTIERAVISSLTQDTKFSYNINIIDDGSEIPVKDSLEKFLDDPRISIFRQKNSGTSVSMNLGCLLTNSKYIIRLDADDELLDGAVEILTKNLEKKPNLSYAYSDGYWIGPLKGWKWEKYCNVNNNKLVNPWEKREYDFRTFLGEMYFGHARIFRKDKFLKVGGYNPKYKSGEDRDFALKMSEVGEIERIPEKLHKYYLLDTGITLTANNKEKEKYNLEMVLNSIKRRKMKFNEIPKIVIDKYKLTKKDL